MCSPGSNKVQNSWSPAKDGEYCERLDQRYYQSHIIYNLIGHVKVVGFYFNYDYKHTQELQAEE